MSVSGKCGWFKGKRVCFVVRVSKNNTFVAIKFAFLDLKKMETPFLENRM